jgi:hypothetical protein
MKSIKYLNFILTVIALLMFGHFCLQAGLIPVAYAAPQTTKVDVNLKEIGGYSIFAGKLKVIVDDEVRMRCVDCK